MKTKYLQVIGGGLWILTLLIRGTSLINNEVCGLIFGVMPNFAATLLFSSLFYEFALRKKPSLEKFKTATASSMLVLIFGIVSEFIHDVFLNAPFDFFDIVVTIIAVMIYLVIAKKEIGSE